MLPDVFYTVFQAGFQVSGIRYSLKQSWIAGNEQTYGML